MKLRKIEAGVYHVYVDGKYVGRVHKGHVGRWECWYADNGVDGRERFSRRYAAVEHVLQVAGVPLEDRPA